MVCAQAGPPVLVIMGAMTLTSSAEARDLDPIGVPEQGDQHAAHQKGVFERVNILELRRGDLPRLKLRSASLE